MILLKDIKNYMKGSIECPAWGISKRNSTDEKSITLYDAQTAPPTINIGGLKNTRMDSKAVSILIHWGKNPTEAELKATEVFNFFFGQEHYIQGHRIVDIKFRQGKPIFLGTDDNGSFEYTLEMNLRYMK